jgi:hypothetical protein
LVLLVLFCYFVVVVVVDYMTEADDGRLGLT